MIISRDNKSKLPKKLLPKRYQVVVSFVSFISSDDDFGIALYKNGDEYDITKYCFEVEQKKLKCKTIEELINLSFTVFDNNREYVKLAKNKFEDEFVTKIDVEDSRDIFELVMENKQVVFKKHIVCVIKSCEEIEHLINPEFVRNCVVVPSSELIEFVKTNNVEEYVLEFLYGQ